MESSFCPHLAAINNNQVISFCKNCGIALLPSIHVTGIKPKMYNYKIDLSPELIYNNIDKFFSPPLSSISDVANPSFLVKRPYVIKNLRSIARKLKFRSHTFFLAILYLDKVMLTIHTDAKPELLGIACLLLAGKYDENDPIFPYVSDLCGIYPKEFFMEDEINRAEIFVLKSLGYKLDYYSAYHYFEFFSLNGIVFTDDRIKSGNSTDRKTQKPDLMAVYSTYEKAKDILHFLLEDDLFIRVPYIYTAISTVLLARQIIGFGPKYIKHFETLYNIKQSDFSSYFNHIKTLYCGKTGVCAESLKSSPAKPKDRRSTITFTSDLLTKLKIEKTAPSVSRDTSGSRLENNTSTNPHSNISSELKPQQDKKTNLLDKYLIVKESKPSSITELNNELLEKIRRPLKFGDVKRKAEEKSLSKEPLENLKINHRKEARGIRNIKKSIFDSKICNLTDLNINAVNPGVYCPKNNQLKESRSILFKEAKQEKEQSLQTSTIVVGEKETLKSRIAKKIDLTLLANASKKDNTAENIKSNHFESGSSNPGISIIKKLATKNSSFNIKKLLEVNGRRLSLMNANVNSLSKNF